VEDDPDPFILYQLLVGEKELTYYMEDANGELVESAGGPLRGPSAETRSALEDWRRPQDDLPTRSEAIRRTIDERLFGRTARPKLTARKRKPSKKV